MPPKRPPSALRAWMQLLRPPNLFTVPGDPLAGYLLANRGFVAPSLAWACAASLLLYSAGLVLNDLADEAEDRRERPSRPVPSGAVPKQGAWAMAILLALGGLAAAWLTGSPASFFIGVALLACVALYDFLLKRWAVPGSIAMGLCRTLSVLVGAFATHPAVTIPAHRRATIFAVLLGGYIAAVTNLARHETRREVPRAAKLGPSIAYAIAGGAGIFFSLLLPERIWATAIFGAGIVLAAWLASRMFEEKPPPLPPLIGSHIRLLLLLQAGACYAADPVGWAGLAACALLLLLWPAAWSFSRWFYAS